MTVTGAIRVDKFKRAMHVYRAEFSRNAGLELKRQARLFTLDCIKLTPPFPQTSPNSTSFTEHRRVGERRVVLDILKVFEPLSGRLSLGRLGKSTGTEGLVFRKPELQARFDTYAKAGNFSAMREMLRRMKFDMSRILRIVDAGLHKVRRDRRGRVRSKGGKWLVEDNPSLRQYITHKVSHVGLAKSGWQRPYYANGGTRLPQWISRHPVRGVYSGGRDGRGFYERVGNDIPWIQETGSELHIIERATVNRSRNMAIEMAKLVQHAKRKSGF